MIHLHVSTAITLPRVLLVLAGIALIMMLLR